MATFITKNYQSIDFSALQDVNVFNTFGTLTNYSFNIIQGTGGTFQTGTTVDFEGNTWTQTYTGNSRNATQTFTSGQYTISYTGSGIVNNSDGVYKTITYTLPYEVIDGLSSSTSPLTVTFEGSLTRFTTGNIGSGTINKITYAYEGLTLELFGNITKSVDLTANPITDTFTGTITGFNFKDAAGNQLSITEISPALSLTDFDNLTFDQLTSTGALQTAQTPETDFVALFTELDKDIYKSGTDTVVVDPGTGVTPGAVGSSSNPYVIPNNIENLPLAEGSTDYYADGNALNNVMTGNSARNFFRGFGGSDTLIGNAGDDTLDGGADKDTLNGGTGNDTYVIDLTTAGGKYEDKLVEAKNAGTDTLAYRSAFGLLSKAVTLKLAKNFENLDISQTGNTNFNLTGDAFSNVLTGNAGNNVIDGGKGADTMIGGDGNDTYVVDNAGDIVTEASNNGTDLVNIKLTTGSYTLGSNVENGLLSSAKTFTLNGNELDNVLTNKKGTVTINGGDGADTLNGGSGTDTLNGDAGNDTLNGGKGNDTLNGGIDNDIINGDAGNDNLIGSSGTDTLNGGAGKDILNGGASNDTMTGGSGADTFVWTLADAGTVGAAAVDTIADFSISQKDVLDLRDLLPSNAVEGDVAGLLANFIDVRIDGTNTVIGINTDGNLGSGENQQITLSNVNLFTLTNTADETALLNNMISKNQLLID